MITACVDDTMEEQARQEIGLVVLHTLAGQRQSDLDELVLVASVFGLEASQVAEAIARPCEIAGALLLRAS